MSALHPDPTPVNKEPSRVVEQHGGEQKVDEATAVISKRTGIYGGTSNPRSCSKICLAKVYPTERPAKAVQMYVVMDD